MFTLLYRYSGVRTLLCNSATCNKTKQHHPNSSCRWFRERRGFPRAHPARRSPSLSIFHRAAPIPFCSLFPAVCLQGIHEGLAADEGRSSRDRVCGEQPQQNSMDRSPCWSALLLLLSSAGGRHGGQQLADVGPVNRTRDRELHGTPPPRPSRRRADDIKASAVRRQALPRTPSTVMLNARTRLHTW